MVVYHKKIVALLRDGKWHSLSDIFKAVARHIDANTADIEYRRRHPGWKSESLKDRVDGGKKRLIFLSLNGMHHHRKTVTVRDTHGKDWDREYRLVAAEIKRLNLKDKNPAPLSR